MKVFTSPQTKSDACIWWWVIGTLTLSMISQRRAYQYFLPFILTNVASLTIWHCIKCLPNWKKSLMSIILTPCPHEKCAIYFITKENSQWVAQRVRRGWSLRMRSWPLPVPNHETVGFVMSNCFHTCICYNQVFIFVHIMVDHQPTWLWTITECGSQKINDQPQ